MTTFLCRIFPQCSQPFLVLLVDRLPRITSCEGIVTSLLEPRTSASEGVQSDDKPSTELKVVEVSTPIISRESEHTTAACIICTHSCSCYVFVRYALASRHQFMCNISVISTMSFAKYNNSKKITVNYGSGCVGRGLTREKNEQNSPILVRLVWRREPSVFYLYIRY